MYNNLKFRTFDQLIAAVADDLYGFDTENSIDSGTLVKDVLKVNKDIGLKINSEYTEIIEVKDYKASLPDNFYLANYAAICNKYRYRYTGQSLTTENIEVCDADWLQAMEAFPEKNAVAYECAQPYIVRKYNELYEYEVNSIIPLKINSNSNRHIHCDDNITIRNNYIVTSFKEGRILLNYFGSLEDEEGNLLVLDHPLINDYYEYTLKNRILENLYLNGENVADRLSYIKGELRMAKIKAYSVVNTPEISEIVNVFARNREKIVNKYFNIIQGNGSTPIPLNVFIP